MDTIRLILRVVGYSGFGLFFIQILNLWVNFFQPSFLWIQIALVTGVVSLFILVLVDRFTNEEDKYYSKNVEK